MNERIKELVKQCTTIVEHGWGASYEQFDKEKFAELLVRECATTVTDRCEMRGEGDVKRAEYHARRIKEHFGVKE